jgi:hypothetical protein
MTSLRFVIHETTQKVVYQAGTTETEAWFILNPELIHDARPRGARTPPIKTRSVPLRAMQRFIAKHRADDRISLSFAC